LIYSRNSDRRGGDSRDHGDLDTQTSFDAIELLQRLNKERSTTVVYVTHDPLISQFAHPVIHMRHGKLADELNMKLLTT
jgi:ABC-type lipoprotein export system ATPase subunit